MLGGPHGRIHPFVRDILDAELAAHSLPAPRAQVTVVPAALGIDAPLVGASELAFEPLLADPAAWFDAAGPGPITSRVPDRWPAPNPADRDARRCTPRPADERGCLTM